MTASVDVLVLGAGLAGLAAAGVLHEAGVSFAVVERSPQVGGRAGNASLTLRGRPQPVDLGAQFFTVSDPRLEALVRNWRARGLVEAWQGGFGRYGPAGFERRQPRHPRHVCPDGMGQLPAALAAELPGPALLLEREGLALLPAPDGRTTALLSDGTELTARAVVLALPAADALALAGAMPVPGLREALALVRFDPCWAAALPTARRPDLPWVGVEVADTAIAWAALDDTRRRAGEPVLAVTARPDWTRARRARPAASVLAELGEAARALFGRWALPTSPGVAVYWPNARPVSLHPSAFAAEGALVACGDWCQSDPDPAGQTTSTRGPRVESAILSGWAAGRHALTLL